ncbi:hypothetical protein GCM10022291_27980 [Postechiella marina]|uniref:Uncharacterized protein n=1 Tax=Postechiella marina TaxID=943941 RepID=A0ABP8CEB1_9FLAO
MESKDYLKDISEIKNLMHKSSRFISLSGLSGVLAGIYALIGAFLAKSKYNQFIGSKNNTYNSSYSVLSFELILIAITVIALAVITGILLTYRKAKKSNENMWDSSSKRLVLNFFFPLLAGGLFCLSLIQYGVYGLVAPATLIFYGLACVNASKYTIGDVRYLGITNIVLGLISTQFIGYGLYFWALGFGGLHIFYGAVMYFKYERK